MNGHSTEVGMQDDSACDKRIGFYAVAFIIAYFLFEAIFVTFISNGAGLDDAEQLANISFFDWGYGGSQPPLYTWILIGATSLFGTHFFVLQLVKFAILASLFLSVYFGLRELKLPSLLAATAMLSLFLLPQIAWESQRALSHSVLGTASCGWVFWAMIRYLKRQTICSASLLGCVIAASVLGKFNDVIFIVAIFMAALSFKIGRNSLFKRQTLLIFVVAIGLLFKPLSWILSNVNATLERSQKFHLDDHLSFLSSRVSGINDFFVAALGFVSIALIVSLVIALINSSQRQALKISKDEQFALKFVGRILLFGLLIVFLMVVGSGATTIKDRWLQPVLFLAPVFFAFLLYGFNKQQKVLNAYGSIGAILALIVPIVLFLGLHLGMGRNLPLGLLQYDQLYASIIKEGPIATIYSPDTRIAGNLRLFDSTIKSVHNETVNGLGRLKRPILVLWEEGERFQKPLDALFAQFPAPQGYREQTINLGYKRHFDKKKIIHYIYIP